MVKLPLRNDVPAFSFQTDLDGTTYNFKFRYNTRMDRWIFDILTAENETILTGIPVLLGTLLTGRFRDERLPAGDFFAINLQDENAEGGRDDLGTNVLILYEAAA